jgi:hypothetical protein
MEKPYLNQKAQLFAAKKVFILLGQARLKHLEEENARLMKTITHMKEREKSAKQNRSREEFSPLFSNFGGIIASPTVCRSDPPLKRQVALRESFFVSLSLMS